MLHQAAKRLGLTLYSPKLHELRKLRSKAEEYDLRLVEAWPGTTRFTRRCFNLLHDASVKARYSPHSVVKAKKLEWLTGRVVVLGQIVARICAGRSEKLPGPIVAGTGSLDAPIS